MSNTYFQFKQFTVQQEKTAMKVCTDACLFGAWVAGRLAAGKITAEKILDIGAGTGLLSLMLAQKTPAQTDAIEIDEDAAVQAKDNFEASAWSDRLHLIRDDARSLALNTRYDLIISNPPFFENDLKSPDGQRNLALHGSELALDELLKVVNNHLSPQGKFAILLPYHRMESFMEMTSREGLFVEENVSVRQTPKHPFFRSMLLMGRQESQLHSYEIVIKNGNDYTPEFRLLLQDYYLYL